MASVTVPVLTLDNNLCVVSATYDDVTEIIQSVTIVNNNAVSVTFKVVNPNTGQNVSVNVKAGSTKTYNIANQNLSINSQVDAVWEWGQ